jgi:HEAT repeat protein
VVPVWQVRDLACALAAAHGGLDLEAGSTGRLDAVERERQLISRNLMGQEDAILRRLGGPEAAAKKLAIYYRMPDQLAPEKYVAVRMMSCCGEHALPGMVLALKDPHWKARKSAAAEIALVGGSGAERTAPALAALLKDPDARVQEVAVAALRRIRGQDSEP